MKIHALAISLLILSTGAAAAHGRGRPGGRSFRRGFSSSGHFSRPLSRPTFARATGSGAASRTGFAAAGTSRGRSQFAGQLAGTGTGSPGGGSGGGTGGTPTPTSSNAPPAWATPGSKILTAGQQPVYSPASGGGTASVDGGGFIAINQSQAGDVGRSPGVTWAQPQSGGSGVSGSGATTNGPAFNAAF